MQNWYDLASLGKTSLEKSHFLSGIDGIGGMGGDVGVGPCPILLALIQKVHFWLLKGVFQTLNFDVQKRGPSCPNQGQGGGVIQGNARKKRKLFDWFVLLHWQYHGRHMSVVCRPSLSLLLTSCKWIFFRNWFLVNQSMEWNGQSIWPPHLIPWSQDPARPHDLVIPPYNGLSFTFSAQIHAREGFPQEFAFFVFVFKMPFSLNPQINLLWKCILLRWNWSSAKHTSLVQKP